MKCRELANFLADYISGELPESVSSEFQKHLGHCGNCDAFLTQYRTTIHAGRAAFDDALAEPLPEDLVKAILAALGKAPVS